MKIEYLIGELENISGQIEYVGHDDQIHLISNLADNLKGKPIVTANGEWKSNEIVDALNRISIREGDVVVYELDTMADILRTWN